MKLKIKKHGGGRILLREGNKHIKTTLHALSYFLTIKYNVPHGHAVALTLGFIGKINYAFGCNNLKML